jgi:transcription initiation factor TFIID subunit 2
MKLIREIEIKQEGYQWQMELKYERDICAQLDAITKLKSFQAKDTRDLLTSIIENHDLYYHVRIEAAHLLAEQSNGQLQLLQTFKKFFMFSNSQKLVKQNNFNDLQLYLIQKCLPVAIGKLRNTHNMCPNDVIIFLIDLIHFNENGKNRFSDCYYKAALIDALNETISSTAVAATNLDYVKSLNSNIELKSVVEEIVLRLNLEKFTPSYHYVITISCLKALRNLQKFGHLPENINIFKQYTRYGTFQEVRKCAFEIIVRFFEGNNLLKQWASNKYFKFLKVRHDEDLMNYLLEFVQNDPSKYIRHYILHLLCKYPPFRPNSEVNNLNSQRLNEKLWKLIQ